MDAGLIIDRRRRGRGPLSAWPTAMIQRLAERTERLVGEHSLLSDVAVALAVGAAGVIGLWSQNRLGSEQVGFTAALSLPLLARRSRPMLVFAGLAVIAALQWLLADPQLADAALLIALYEVALGGNLVEFALATAVLETGAVMAAVKWAPSDLVLEASDTGPPSVPRAQEGRGLRGMRERALAYGGELEAGPGPQGGWRVRMTIGYREEGG